MDAAPLYSDHPLCELAICEFIETAPDIFLRVAKWTGGTRGTVHIFNGRTEYIEKYLDVISEFRARGFNVTAHDWRGQGLSTRNKKHPTRCHIKNFNDHQSDARAVMAHFAKMDGPHFLFCHSMGGAIGTRYLAENNDIKAAVFSAPMLGIHLSAFLETIRPFVFRMVKRFGRQWATAPSTKDKNYELHAKFKGNLLTSHKPAWEHMKNVLTSWPALQCGGPTYFWSEAAYKEMAELAKIPKIETPALMIMGTDEKVVSQQAIRDRMDIQDNWRMVECEAGRHENYIETDEIRQKIWLHMDMFLDQFS